MKIAVLGATSQIAKDLIANMLKHGDYQLVLYSRNPGQVKTWLATLPHSADLENRDYAAFSEDQGNFDAILNFVGVGDPAKALAMGSSIIEITETYDNLALHYIRKNPDCKYIFLSSGAVYGGTFSLPVDEATPSTFPVNSLGQTDWYGIAKLYTETKHRALKDHAIIDLRVFNYLSSSLNVETRFFITDLLRAVQKGEEFVTNDIDIQRDFLSDREFYQMIECALKAPKINAALDCYTSREVGKFEILEFVKKEYGTPIQVTATPATINATGMKLNYFSKNHRAQEIGYSPQASSLENIRSLFQEKVLR